MDLDELEEFLGERLYDFTIKISSKGEVIIHTGLILDKMTNELTHESELEKDEEDDSDDESELDF